MNLLTQKENFYRSVYPSRPNSWEVDEIFELLADYDEKVVSSLLDNVPAIWPVSHSLCFAYLTEGVAAVQHISGNLFTDWVRQLLGVYERKGLVGARQFMADVDRFFLSPLLGKDGVAFEEIAGKMVPYLKGVSGKTYNFDFASLPSTDTETIFLPSSLDTFVDKIDNVLLYKLLISLQWGNVKSGLFSKEFADKTGSGQSAGQLFAAYSDKGLAEDLFAAIQFLRVFRYLSFELPGLARRSRKLCLKLIDFISPLKEEGRIGLHHSANEQTELNELNENNENNENNEKNDQCDYFKKLLTAGLFVGTGNVTTELKQVDLSWLTVDDCKGADNFTVLSGLYRQVSELPGSYQLGSAALLLGEFDFIRAEKIIRIRREKEKDRFVGMLAGFLKHLPQASQLLEKEEPLPRKNGSKESEAIKDSLLVAQQGQGKRKKSPLEILLANDGHELSDELLELINNIEEDIGGLPDAYVQAAAGQAGHGVNRIDPGENHQADIPLVRDGAEKVYSYDEWDYRRGGYRADWCLLREKNIRPVHSSFIAETLSKYQGQLHTLRHQFEMLRTRDRFVRRQRHGDDIDLDALVEALGDSRAGLSASDRLFVQLLRDERDIATIFLVDMSNSTEGWVGKAMKESLVLLAEAIEVVGDSYAIYGFSGMRRSKSELYCVKAIDENYGEDVQGKIAAIGPKEYTRMGPPIRHLTKKIQRTQAKIRLLVVISDGKPEDYDDYKGQYAIEDTRKALQEARGSGVHPFCITIDKAAHNYLSHMFGRGNYIFIDNVQSLPQKMANMYRLLTR